MKKYLFIVLALLLICGVANAGQIPMVVDPSAGPEIWTTEVFNDAGSALTSSQVVVWDYTDSDMDTIATRKMYVTTTTTVDDIAVAGVVVDDTIADQNTGTIAIWGPVRTWATGSGVTAGTAVGTSATAGKCAGYANTSNDDSVLGWSIEASTDGEATGGADISIVFVNPSVVPD